VPGLYPPVEPYEHGMLSVGDGNLIYWETCGNPAGKPALVVHGGPGSGCTPGHRREFDPRRYRVILFDQRGCGRSSPHASHPATDMSRNTTGHLLADMEKLREHLGVDRWLVSGGSWGCTLSLAYAQRYPGRVTQIVLYAVATSTRAEISWLYRGLGQFFPAEWERFRDGVPEGDRDGDLTAAYDALMENPDPAVRAQAAASWCAWEDAGVSQEPGFQPPGPYSRRPPGAQAAFVRICAHYFSHGAWLAESALLRGASSLAGIPGVLIHGRLDLTCPLGTAWALAREWPGSRLIVAGDAGHLGSGTMNSHLIGALDGFAAM
jgi:proline iminopeptidase